MGPSSRLFTILLWVALLAAIAIEISGFRTSHIFEQAIWSPEGLRRFTWYGLICTGLGAGLWFQKRYFIPLALGMVLLGTLVAVGPAAPAATLLFVFSTTVLGKLLFGQELEGPLAFLTGTAIWILVMACIVRVPIHYPVMYLIALALPVVLGYPVARQLAGGWLRLFRPSSTLSLPEYVSAFLVAFVAVAHWLVVLKPEVSADGLAMHLAAASNISLHHAFTIDFRQFVWALMPMGADWCYSVVYVLGGEYAARLLNLALLAVIGLLLFGVARRWVANAVAAFIVFLFLSTPLVQFVTGSLFVENFVAAMSLGAGVAVWKLHEKGAARYLLLAALLLGTSVALKLGAVVVAVLILPFFIAAGWKTCRGLRTALPAGAVAILIATASVPYVHAYSSSGNPIFPFENARFHSPYYANEDISDERYKQPVTWTTPVMLTFRTSRYYEGQNGSFGLQYFLLLPLTLVCLASMRSFAGRSAAVIGLGSASIIAVVLPNARYFYPALPFLTLGAAAALARIAGAGSRIFHASLAACLLAGILNLYLLPASNYYHKDFFSSPLFSKAGRNAYVRQLAPIRELVAYVNRVDRTHPVVLTDSSSFAGLMAPAYTLNWHDYAFQKQVEESGDPEYFYRTLGQLGVRRLLVEPNPARDKFVDTLLARCARPEYELPGYAVVQIAPDCETKLRAVDTPLSSGKYDETDARLTFQGSWTQGRNLPFAYQQTVAYSDRAGAQVSFKLNARGLRYAYTGAYNRGMAEILVDGSPKMVVDLYSPDIVWQAQVTIAGLAPGVHEITIRGMQQKNPKATGHYIDIDSIEILDGPVKEERPPGRLESN